MGREQSKRLWLTVVGLMILACGPMRVEAAAQSLSANAAPTSAASAQEPALGTLTTTPCDGTPLSMPAALPPVGSAPFVWVLQPCFPRQGNTPVIESETYMYYIKLRGSQP